MPYLKGRDSITVKIPANQSIRIANPKAIPVQMLTMDNGRPNGPVIDVMASLQVYGPYTTPTDVNLVNNGYDTVEYAVGVNPQLLDQPYILAQSAVPVMIAQSSVIGATGLLRPGTFTAQSLSLSGTSGSVTCTFAGAVLAGNSSDVGKQITFFDGGTLRSILITAFTSTTVCTGTLASTSSIGPHTTNDFGNPLPTNYSGGIWVYLPAGTVTGGSAGFYWCVATSTATANGILQVTTAYQSSMGVPSIPTGFSNAVGSGANFTGVTSQILLASVVVPGGAMGNNGTLRMKDVWQWSINSNAKFTGVLFASQNIGQLNTQATGGGICYVHSHMNRGVPSQQLNTSANQSDPGLGASYMTAIDTGNSQSVVYRGQTSVATDFVVLEGFTIEVLPRA